MAAIIEQADTRPVLELADLRLHCRIDEDDEAQDVLLLRYLAAASRVAEERIGGPLLMALVCEYLDAWPSLPVVRLEKTGGHTLQSVQVWRDGALTELALGEFYAVPDDRLLCIKPVRHWPRVDRRPGAVVIRYRAGLAEAPDTLPDDVKQWLRFQVATLYANREDVVDSNVVALPNHFVDGLITHYIPRTSLL